jgi:hypothetical protein
MLTVVAIPYPVSPFARLQSLERSTLGRFEALNPRHRRSHILSNENRQRSLLLAHATTSNLKYIYALFTFNSEDCCRLGRQTIGLGQRFGVDREVIVNNIIRQKSSKSIKSNQCYQVSPSWKLFPTSLQAQEDLDPNRIRTMVFGQT